MPPEHGRADLRTDDDLERILDWLTARTGYQRPGVQRVALWALASRLGMPDLPPLRRLLGVKPGRKPKAPAPPAAPEEAPDA